MEVPHNYQSDRTSTYHVSESKVQRSRNGFPTIKELPEGSKHNLRGTRTRSLTTPYRRNNFVASGGDPIDINSTILKGKATIANRKAHIEIEKEDSRRGFHEDSIKFFISKHIAILATKYYEIITFRQECYLMFILLIPLVLVVVALLYLDSVVFESKSTALVAKIAIVLGGALASHINDMLNERHGRLSGMAEIINQTATLQSICGTVRGHKKSKLLHYITILFYACLIATELSLTTIHVASEYGSGISLDMNEALKPSEIASFPGLLLSAAGSQFACSTCSGFRSLDVLLVPVTNKLKGGIISNITGYSGEIDLLAKSAQDIISVEASCIDVKPSASVLNDNQILLDVEEANVGVGASMYMLYFSANSDSNERKSKKCTLVVREYNGSTLVRYGLSPTGGTVRRKVESVEPIYYRTCSKIGKSCLDQAKRTGLADNLIKMVFSQKSYLFNQRLAYSSNVAPDPSAPGSDRIFEENVQKLIGNALIIAASIIPSKEVPVTLQTDTIQVKLIVKQWLLILTVAVASIAAIYPMMLISIGLIRIKKNSNHFLRLLYERVQPGKEFIEDSAVLCVDLKEDHHTALIKYGEDKKTVSNAIGVLRFGLKHDIAKYKENRPYY